MLLLNLIGNIRTTASGNFNTSYVVIKRNLVILIVRPLRYFNTSYVVIKRERYNCSRDHSTISIHLMLLLNRFNKRTITISRDISIHLMLLLNLTILETGLYVVCYFNTSYVVIKQILISHSYIS